MKRVAIQPWIRLIESEDTAKSAAELAESGQKGVGAVASVLAAEKFGLEILERSIETYQDNFTRFLILDDNLTLPQESINKASLCFTLPHKPGSLAHILTILSFYEMDLTRIQSLLRRYPLPKLRALHAGAVSCKAPDQRPGRPGRIHRRAELMLL